MKVFCNDCKFREMSGILPHCKASKKVLIHDDFDKPKNHLVSYILCRTINEKNDCKDYQPNLWKRLKNKLFRTKDYV
jgi:hypothetical protein